MLHMEHGSRPCDRFSGNSLPAAGNASLHGAEPSHVEGMLDLQRITADMCKTLRLLACLWADGAEPEQPTDKQQLKKPIYLYM